MPLGRKRPETAHALGEHFQKTGYRTVLLAAFCMERRVVPHAVREQPALLQDFQEFLTGRGVELHWWRIP